MSILNLNIGDSRTVSTLKWWQDLRRKTITWVNGLPLWAFDPAQKIPIAKRSHEWGPTPVPIFLRYVDNSWVAAAKEIIWHSNPQSDGYVRGITIHTEGEFPTGSPTPKVYASVTEATLGNSIQVELEAGADGDQRPRTAQTINPTPADLEWSPAPSGDLEGRIWTENFPAGETDLLVTVTFDVVSKFIDV